MTESKAKSKVPPVILESQSSKIPGKLGGCQPGPSIDTASLNGCAADTDHSKVGEGLNLNVDEAAGLTEAAKSDNVVVEDAQFVLPSIDQCCLTLWFFIETGNVQSALSFLNDCDRRFGNGAASLRGEMLERLVVRACSEVPAHDNICSTNSLILRRITELPAIAVPFLANGPVISTHYTMLMAQVERQKSQIESLLSLMN